MSLDSTRYFSTPVEQGDTSRVLATLRYIHANPKAAGVRKGFHDPYSNYGHYEGPKGDGLSEWHPAFLQLAITLEGCARRYAHYCRRYRSTGQAGPQTWLGQWREGRRPQGGAPGQQMLAWGASNGSSWWRRSGVQMGPGQTTAKRT